MRVYQFRHVGNGERDYSGKTLEVNLQHILTVSLFTS